jgi:hypothetical protein
MTGRPESNPVRTQPLLGADWAFTLPRNPRTIDFWDAWAFAAVESGLALEAWLSASSAEKELGYCAYVAALDREEQAATALAVGLDPAAAARIRPHG